MIEQQKFMDALLAWERGQDLIGNISEESWRLICEAFSAGVKFGDEQARQELANRYGEIDQPGGINFVLQRDTALLLLGWIQAHRPPGDWEPGFLGVVIGLLERTVRT